MRHTDFSSREIPLSQLGQPLSPAAESGQVGRDLGYLPARQMTPSPRCAISPTSVRYVHPALGSHHPLVQRHRPDSAT